MHANLLSILFKAAQALRQILQLNRQRTAGAAFANYRDDNRRFQRRHFVEIAPDGLGLATLFGTDAEIAESNRRQREES